MIRFIRYFYIGLFVFISVSCTKVNIVNVDIAKLAQTKWYLVKMALIVDNPVSPEYNADTIIYPQDCAGDDFLKFLPDSSFIQYYGITKCRSTDPDSIIGKWSYNKSNLSLLLESDFLGEQIYRIDQLNVLNMILIQESAIKENKGNSTVTIRSKKTYYYQNK
jgi:hypothetical protein